MEMSILSSCISCEIYNPWLFVGLQVYILVHGMTQIQFARKSVRSQKWEALGTCPVILR